VLTFRMQMVMKKWGMQQMEVTAGKIGRSER
jgi:hypothetical protein